MERAAAYAPYPKEFPSPKTAPVWVTHKLQYALSGGYYYAPSYSGSASPQTTTGSGSGGADGFSQIPDTTKKP